MACLDSGPTSIRRGHRRLNSWWSRSTCRVVRRFRFNSRPDGTLVDAARGKRLRHILSRTGPSVPGPFEPGRGCGRNQVVMG